MQNKRPIRKKSRVKFFYVVPFLAGLLIISGILSFFRFSRWDKAYRFTIVINSNPLYVLSVEPSFHKIVILTIPGNVYLAVPYGYGNYPAASVFRLGSLDSKRGGGNLLEKSIENTLGIVVEGYLSTKTQNPEGVQIDSKAEIKRIKSRFFSLTGMLMSISEIMPFQKQLDTNLSAIDKFNLWNAIRNTRMDDIAVLDLDGASALTEEKLPDGTMVKVIDKELFDAFISDEFQDQLVRSEKVSLEIINASDRDGLASLFGRTIKNLGANVVVKSTSEKSEDFVCQIRLSQKDNADSHIVKRLRKLFQCDIGSVLLEKNIADVQVILGKQFLQ